MCYSECSCFLLNIMLEHFMSCCCEPLVVTLVRTHLWPASPQRPLHLIYWTGRKHYSLSVLKDLCKALYFKCSHLVVKVYINMKWGRRAL